MFASFNRFHGRLMKNSLSIIMAFCLLTFLVQRNQLYLRTVTYWPLRIYPIFKIPENLDASSDVFENIINVMSRF